MIVASDADPSNDVALVVVAQRAAWQAVERFQLVIRFHCHPRLIMLPTRQGWPLLPAALPVRCRPSKLRSPPLWRQSEIRPLARAAPLRGSPSPLCPATLPDILACCCACGSRDT